ncbi:uncharacterized protein L201_003352 [Kwoniella dendrophila CBS 6074]|uniref:Uncharacterized protein n=1 Tax=Kwoniella dendrophila CBS 6074 TaxID=1295534 RepID=A0AAX4JSL5_9TREE
MDHMSVTADVHSKYQLFFPPFFTPPPCLELKVFSEWSDEGVWVTSNTQANGLLQTTHNTIPHDKTDTPLISVGHPFAGIGISFEEKEEHKKAKRREAQHRKKDATGRPGFRVPQEDCWKIGHDSSWLEPEGTSKSLYDESIPPFSRLLSAVQDFEYSRHSEFQFHRNKRLFQLFRNALGLKSSFRGNHWPGSGPYGVEYVGPKSHAMRDNEFAPSAFDDNDQSSVPNEVEEVCVLLRKPEISIRGLLALARREAEAGWHFEPAHKFTVIAAAFMSFLIHYEVFPEASLKNELVRARDIARSAPQALLDAKALEDTISHGPGWNRAAWTLYGGAWGGAERGGLEKEVITWGSQNTADHSDKEESTKDEETSDNGGWSVEPIIDDRPAPLGKDEVISSHSRLTHPLNPERVSLIQYLPFSRRRVVAVLPPAEPRADIPAYASRCHQLVTVPAPWTPNEKWRILRPKFDDEGSEDEESDSGGPAVTTSHPLDQEKATIDEPDKVSIWVESHLFDDNPGLAERLPGAGLRGRWGLMGQEEGSETNYTQWWTFKAKDYILPAFWHHSTK